MRRTRRTLDATRPPLLRAREDLYVLKVSLEERNVVTKGELVNMRSRLIEAPRRRAQEREQLTQNIDIPASGLIVDEGDSVH